jgi:A/G-specific adenine glycosylase
LAWFARHKRDLPWRRTLDPYHVWVSEIMLQQTQVATVVPYFERFIDAFPTVEELASADEQAVLRQWEGLGYYRRARQMHRAALVLVDKHGGRFPRSVEMIRELPGIGRYTAGAVASIAFDLPAPILEANTVRLLSRLVAFRGDPAKSDSQKALWALAADILPPTQRGDFNQALMELGSQVCTPRAPACQRCPVSSLCAALGEGRQDSIPATRSKPASQPVREAAVVVWHRGRVLLRRCEAGERWAGLWDVLRFQLTARGGASLARELTEKVRNLSGLSIPPPEHVATLRHTVTRFRITLSCYNACVSGSMPKLDLANWRWVDLAAADDYPLSTTGRKLLRLVAQSRCKTGR